MKFNTKTRITLQIGAGLLILANCIAVGYMFGSQKTLLREANGRAILCTAIADAIRDGRTDVARNAVELLASGSVSTTKDYQGSLGALRLTRVLLTSRLDKRDGCSVAAEYLAHHDEATFEPQAARYLRARYPASFAAK